jgi:hypothetical protein
MLTKNIDTSVFYILDASSSKQLQLNKCTFWNVVAIRDCWQTIPQFSSGDFTFDDANAMPTLISD